MKEQDLDRVKSMAKDLRQEEPRSPAEQMAGFELAARALDKCRATLAGCQGDFQFGCPMDQMFFQEAGIRQKDFETFVATGASDQEVEDWIEEKTRRRAA